METILILAIIFVIWYILIKMKFKIEISFKMLDNFKDKKETKKYVQLILNNITCWNLTIDELNEILVNEIYSQIENTEHISSIDSIVSYLTKEIKFDKEKDSFIWNNIPIVVKEIKDNKLENYNLLNLIPFIAETLYYKNELNG